MGTLHAWTSSILPFLEEADLAARIDYSREWNDPAGNRVASKQEIAAYACPSGVLSYVGKADYAGISGAWMLGVDGVPFLGAAGLTNGVLVPRDRDTGHVQAAHVTDGLSATLLAAESTDRGPAPGEDADPEDPTGRWAVHNCGPQSSGFINTETSDIRSLHPGGAQAAFADARVVFLSESMDPVVLAAICALKLVGSKLSSTSCGACAVTATVVGSGPTTTRPGSILGGRKGTSAMVVVCSGFTWSPINSQAATIEILQKEIHRYETGQCPPKPASESGKKEDLKE
jgi:hypothetical protein